MNYQKVLTQVIDDADAGYTASISIYLGHSTLSYPIPSPDGQGAGGHKTEVTHRVEITLNGELYKKMEVVDSELEVILPLIKKEVVAYAAYTNKGGARVTTLDLIKLGYSVVEDAEVAINRNLDNK